MATIVVGTNSYVTEAELTTYATDRGIIISGSTSQLLIKAWDYIDSRNYRGRKFSATQPLEFPRYYTAEAPETAPAVPEKIKTAQIVAALLTDSGVDLFASIERAVKREKVDVIEVEYMDNANATALYPRLIGLLAEFIDNSNNGFQFAVTKS